MVVKVVPNEMGKRNDFVLASEMSEACHIVSVKLDENLGDFYKYF